MVLRIVYFVFGMVALLNGFQMLFAAESWFSSGPPGVEHTGHFNAHFVRDLGVLFVIMGAGLLWSIFNLDKCYPVHVGIAAWLVGHGLVHVVEIFREELPGSHWQLDFFGVFLPGIIMAVLAIPIVWRRLTPAPASA